MMSFIRTYPLPNSAILRLNSEREYIDVAPSYQRVGGVWSREKKSLLIDSVINDYDIPKLYFHAFSLAQKKEYGGQHEYSIIDGRQRIETIWQFIDDEFPLAEDFIYFADRDVELAGMHYSELAKSNPRIKIRFDSYALPVVCVETDDLELIEDMFSRLNEAVPLNAAEKRSALGGPMASVIKEVAQHKFFNTRVRFSDSRYRYREVAARLLFLEYSQAVFGRILDTKKPYLDDMVLTFKRGEARNLHKYKATVTRTLNELSNIFAEEDELLRSQAVIPVFYLVVQRAIQNSTLSRVSRDKITKFYENVAGNRQLAEEKISRANFEMLEFDRMSQQGTNDAASISERTDIMSRFLGV